MSESEWLLEVRNLKKTFPAKNVTAVDGASFGIRPGETVGIVGASGCGKSTLAKMAAHLLKADEGDIYFEGELISEKSGRSLSHFRRHVRIIFQEPFLSFNPVMKIGEAVAEPLWVQGMRERRSIEKEVREALASVGLGERYRERRPHELSGGECQRAAIARALVSRPALLICDEVVSALDALVRVDILNLFLRIQEERRLSMLFISHDLAVIRHMSDRVLAMKEGKIVS